ISSGRKPSPSSPWSARRRSPRRPVPITRQPPPANLRAAASPIPAVAPVIRIVFIRPPRVIAGQQPARRALRQSAPERRGGRAHGLREIRSAPRAAAARLLFAATPLSRFRSAQGTAGRAVRRLTSPRERRERAHGDRLASAKAPPKLRGARRGKEATWPRS